LSSVNDTKALGGRAKFFGLKNIDECAKVARKISKVKQMVVLAFLSIFIIMKR
jgi:hypothetical protein